MKPLQSKEEIEQFIGESDFRLVYFASDACSVCQHMREEAEVRYGGCDHIELGLVRIEDVPEARGAYQVFAAPTIHVYFDGQRIYEAGRFLQFEELDEKMKRIEAIQSM